MRIVDVRERVVPIESAIRNAVISFEHMTVSLVAVVTDQRRDGRRVIGYGFNSNGRYAQSGLLRERFIPRLLAAAPEDLLDESGANLDPGRAWGVLMRDEKPGGHGDRSVAMGILDMALWDVVGKIAGRPLAAVLADRFGEGPPLSAVPVYAAGGYYYPGAGIAELRDEIRRYLDLGYTSVKIKIGGATLAQDLERIEAVLALLPGPEHLAVDANGRFDAAEAIEYANGLEPYGLRWYEEPVDPLDYGALAEVAGVYGGPLATGENLFGAVEVLNLVRFGGLRPDRDVLQMDPALAYGLVGFLQMLDALETAGWSRRSCIPHGGHQMNLAVAAGLRLGAIESYPEHFQPIGGFADDLPVIDGKASLSELPGIGIEAKARLYGLASELVRDLS
jgi:L-alanine-DL-glutamate epimerase-like enolase superfamily enzyme